MLFLWYRTEAAPTTENHKFDALLKEKDVAIMKLSRPEADGWPQIPISLVNQFGKSEDNQTKR
jgi:hypothetical protein